MKGMETDMKKILVIMMALVLCFSMVACSSSASEEKAEDETTKAPVVNTGDGVIGSKDDLTDDEPEETEPVDDGMVDYTVTVTDEEGNPVVGASLQICDENNCLPSMTPSDENGVIVFHVEEAEYKVSFLALPEGYAYVDEAVTDFYFESGAKEITVVIKAVA